MSSAVALPADALEPKGRGVRDDALDFTKGALVLLMVFYHWYNYFISVEGEVYRYLRFLTPSFIFITGFLVSHVYLPRIQSGDTRVYRRLFERGAKILFLFTLLNLGAGLLVKRNYNGVELGVGSFLSDAYRVYVTGTGAAVFDVLVPIGYFLLLSPIVLAASRKTRLSLHIVAAFVLLLVVVAAASGVHNTNLELLAIGVLGLSAGAMHESRLGALTARPLMLVIAYGLYVAAINLWNVLFLLQVVGVCLSLLLIYSVGLRCASSRVFHRHVRELGKYSLLAYIAQVAFLQVLRSILDAEHLPRVSSLLLLIVTLAAVSGTVELVVMWRARSLLVDRLYRTVLA